jgi:hypothetical protein
MSDVLASGLTRRFGRLTLLLDASAASLAIFASLSGNKRAPWALYVEARIKTWLSRHEYVKGKSAPIQSGP